MYVDYMNSPVGILEIGASERGVTQVIFCESESRDINKSSITSRVVEQLNEYFNRDRECFDLPFDQEGTQFQQAVWQQLLHIPFGQTASYGDVAKAMNNPKAMRAVGAANGKNPISIIVPCHRVIGSNGSLTGYAGGLARKTWLLKHENAQGNMF
ncbi:MAG: cysteine methyltransferase [Alteromonadaceae bacterium]|nr:MAG: cysteine methyltransferase [Alteromonadaceae bacterium]